MEEEVADNNREARDMKVVESWMLRSKDVLFPAHRAHCFTEHPRDCRAEGQCLQSGQVFFKVGYHGNGLIIQ
jgi:hypothetical protein